MSPAPFFAYARERQSVLLRRRACLPKPWTKDEIIQRVKFCNVFREDDVTTIWLREHVRAPLAGKPELFLATILFRWFNRITTGRAIFVDKLEEFHWTAWEKFIDIWENTGTWNTDVLKTAILRGCGDGPYVTGAYCIIGAPHMPKIDGILRCFQNVCEGNGANMIADTLPGFATYGWKRLAEGLLSRPGEITLEEVWDWFRRFPRSGDFMAYEVVTDLSKTALMDRAPDLMTWANAGPGAIRGLNRLNNRPLNMSHPKKRTNDEMRQLLHHSNFRDCWPQADKSGGVTCDHEVYVNVDSDGGPETEQWPAWDMRTVEHTLCEFDKHERVRLNQGKVKGAFRGIR